MARNYVRTIQDMERYFYGGTALTGYSYSSGDILKADAPLLSTTAGTYQAIYGRKVWSQLNQEFNAFSILPKKPWERSGWRILTGRASFTKGGGMAENATLPDTTKPDFLHVAAKPKTIAHTFDLSEVSMFLADKDDGLGDVRTVLKEEMGKHHAEHINRMLTQDLDTPAGNDLESLDRVTSDPDNMTTGTSHVSATTDHDMYSITRDGSVGFHSAEVSVSSSKGTNRTLALDHLDTIFQQMWTRGGNPKVILTGYDTLMRVQQLLQSQQRFMESKTVTPTYNGVKGVPGIEAGFIVATYNGIPIIPSKDVTAAASGISRMYYLDTDYLWFQTAIPTQYFESGIETGDPFAINRLGQEGLYRTMGEVWCSFFGGMGSIRDLS
tara:strand:+ start:4197 stop:5342 length:1146 start_codon:yes stop_codon:yes gene_type:complete